VSFDIRPLRGEVGAEVLGCDLSQQLDANQMAELEQLWLEHGVLLFRRQQVSAEQQIEFSRRLGELEVHPISSIRAKEHDELMELDSKNPQSNPLGYYDGEPVVGRLGWHKDLIYTAKPNRGAVLRPVILPPRDGQTGFGDQALAYDRLDESMKRRIESLQVIYRFDVHLPNFRYLDTSNYQPGPGIPRSVEEAGFESFPDAVYPMVLTHPINKRRILNVCPMFLDGVHGMDEAEGDELLRELVAHVTRPEFTYWHDWELSDLLLWDNWRMMHATRGSSPEHDRKIQRTTIRGDVVLGRALERTSMTDAG